MRQRTSAPSLSLAGVQLRGLSAAMILILVGSLAVSIAVGLLVARESYSLLATMPVAFFALWALCKPRVAVTLFYLSVFVPFGYLQRYFVSMPVITLWLPHLFLLFAIVSVLFFSKQTRHTFPLPASLVRVGVLWLGIALASLVYNGSSPVAALLSFRGLFLIFGSVLLHRLLFSTADQERLITALVWIGVAVLPVTLFQRTYLVESLRLGSGDMVTGLFTVYGDLVFFQLFCILAVAGWWLHKKRLISLSPALAVVVLFAPLAISNSKAAPLYFLLSATFLLWLCRSRLSMRLLGAVLVLAIVGATGTVLFDKIFQSSYGRPASVVKTFYNPEAMVSYLLSDRGTASGGLQRGAAVVFNYELIKDDPITLLLGLGPGALSDSKVPGGTGRVFARYPNLALNNNQLSTAIGEGGVLTVLFVGLLLLSLYRARHESELGYVVVLRKSVVFLIATLLIYMPVFLSPLIALVAGVVSCCQPNNELDHRTRERDASQMPFETSRYRID